VAPLGYKGWCAEIRPAPEGIRGWLVLFRPRCAEKTSFGQTLEEKREAETICAVAWPEPDGCARDWAAPCPFGYTAQEIRAGGWSETRAASCAQDLEYAGPCSDLEVEFPDVASKQRFAERCFTSWPCETSCGTSPVRRRARARGTSERALSERLPCSVRGVARGVAAAGGPADGAAAARAGPAQRR